MNTEETLVLQGIKLEIAYLSAEMAKISQRLPGEPGAEALAVTDDGLETYARKFGVKIKK